MLVIKGGISRNIDEKRLPEYKAKGFAPVAPEAPKKDEGKAQKNTDKE